MGWLSWFFESKETLKVGNPAAVFEKPIDLAKSRKLSRDEIRKALNDWEQDARQLMTASNEGMPGPEEGLDPDDHHQMEQVVRAKEAIGEKPQQKSAH